MITHSLRSLIRELVESQRWKFDESRVRAGQYENCWTGVETIYGIPLQIKTSRVDVNQTTNDVTIDFHVFYEDTEVVYEPITYEPEYHDCDFIEVLRRVGDSCRQRVIEQFNDPDSELIRAINKHELLKQLPPWRQGRWSLPAGTFLTRPLPEKISGSLLEIGTFQLIIPDHSIGAVFPIILRAREEFNPKGRMGCWVIASRLTQTKAMRTAEKWLWEKLGPNGFDNLDDFDFLRHLFRRVLTTAR